MLTSFGEIVQNSSISLPTTWAIFCQNWSKRLTLSWHNWKIKNRINCRKINLWLFERFLSFFFTREFWLGVKPIFNFIIRWFPLALSVSLAFQSLSFASLCQLVDLINNSFCYWGRMVSFVRPTLRTCRRQPGGLFGLRFLGVEVLGRWAVLFSQPILGLVVFFF